MKRPVTIEVLDLRYLINAAAIELSALRELGHEAEANRLEKAIERAEFATDRLTPPAPVRGARGAK